MNKVVRIQIAKPIDCEWEDFKKMLKVLQKSTRYAMNKTIDACWEYDGFSSEYKKEYGKNPDTKEVLNYTLEGFINNKIKNDAYELYSSNLSTSLGSAVVRWKEDLSGIRTGEQSIPSYKKNISLDLHNKAVDILFEKSKYYANLKLISNPYKKELDRKSCQYCVLLLVKDATQKAILQRILSGEYKITASKLVEAKVEKKGKSQKKWFLNLGYNFEAKTSPTTNSDIIMGIDMGISNAVCFAFNNKEYLSKHNFITGGEIEQFRKQMEKRKIQMLSQGKYCGEGRKGHGIATRNKPIAHLNCKISNFSDTVNDRYSKYIIDMAVKNDVGLIRMEDLSGISKDDRFLKNWTYFDLQTKIEQKAKAVGISTLKINPKYTSQRCNKCGNISKDNRKTQSDFCCIACGYKTNADFNAAKNIAMKDIEYIIEQTMNISN